MAQFNIDAHLSDGKKLQWLAIADEGESLQSVADQVKRAASKKFGPAVLLSRLRQAALTPNPALPRSHRGFPPSPPYADAWLLHLAEGLAVAGHRPMDAQQH